MRPVCGIGNPPGRVAKEPTMDEVRTLVLRKVAIFERAQACEDRGSQARSNRSAARKISPDSPG